MRRLSGAGLALLVLVTLVARVGINMAANDWGPVEALWSIYRFFTIWTVTLSGVAAALIAMGARVPQGVVAGLVLSITMVAGVYYALLFADTDNTGLDWWVDLSLHALVPVWLVLHWLALEPKDTLGPRNLVLWLVYPALYCVYALTRGALDGTYPYGFINPDRLGAAGVGLNVLGLMVAFFLGGAVILAVARATRR